MASQPFNVALQDDIITIKFDKDAVLTPECIMDVIAQMNQLCDLSQHNALFDARGALPSEDLGYTAMERIINFIDNNPDFHWNPRLAFVVDAGVQYGLSRMFQTLADQFPGEIRIFSDKAETTTWITDNSALSDRKESPPG